MLAQLGLSRRGFSESNSTGSIAAHPCKKRKDGAPSVECRRQGSLKVGTRLRAALTNSTGAVTDTYDYDAFGI